MNIIKKQDKLLKKFNNIYSKLGGKKITKHIIILNSKLISLKTEIENEFKKNMVNSLLNKRFFNVSSHANLLIDMRTGIIWNKQVLYHKKFNSNSIGKFGYKIFNKWEFPNEEDFLFFLTTRSYPLIVNENEVKVFWLKNGKAFHVKENKIDDLPERKYGSKLFICRDFEFEEKINSNPVIEDYKKVNIFLKKLNSAGLVLDLDGNEILKEYSDKIEIFQNLLTSFEKLDLIYKKNKLNTDSGLAVMLDYDIEMLDYDLSEIDKNFSIYNKSIIKWLDNLLSKIENYKNKEKVILQDSISITKNIAEVAENYDNNVLNKRHQFLSRDLDFGFNNVIAKLLQFKEEAHNIEKRLKNADNIEELCNIEKEKHPTFKFIASHTIDIYKQQVEKIGWFKENKSIAEQIIDLHKDWCKDYLMFLKIEKEELIKRCKTNFIDEDIIEEWFLSWKKERDLIEDRLIDLVEAGLARKISFEIINKIVSTLNKYKESLKEYYQDTRVNVYINNIERDYDGYFEKIEAEKRMVNLSEDFYKDLEEIIFLPKKQEDRLFVARWSNQWFDNRIKELVISVEKGSISEYLIKKTIADFKQIQKENFEILINDKKEYAEAREIQYTRVQALMRRMTKELEKNNLDKLTGRR